MVPEGIGSLQMMVTVPKKKRRKAVDRVQMRRRIREAYRLHRLRLRKYIEDTPSIRTLSMALVYVHDKNLPYLTMEEKMKSLLHKIESRLTPKEPK